MRLSELVHYEEPTARYSRSVIKATAPIVMGSVIKADGKPITAATVSDAYGVALADAATGMSVLFLARHAIVRRSGLSLPALTEEQDAALVSALEAKGVVINA